MEQLNAARAYACVLTLRSTCTTREMIRNTLAFWRLHIMANQHCESARSHSKQYSGCESKHRMSHLPLVVISKQNLHANTKLLLLALAKLLPIDCYFLLTVNILHIDQ